MGRRRHDDPTVAGILLVDKPAGPTSHDVVGRVRRAVRVRRVGHSGTLDPAATGLVLVGVGWVTRVLRYTDTHPKRYRADIAFGAETDTCDSEGEVIATASTSVDPAALERVLAGFEGEIDQVPPAHSAIKVGGEKLYEKARRGEHVRAEARRVTIHEITVVDCDPDEASVVLDIACSSGTYIRSLARDLGRALGGAAHLAALRRTRIGPHDVDSALELEAVQARGRDALEAPALAVAGLDTFAVDTDGMDAVLSGRRVGVPAGSGPVAALGPAGELLAVYERTDGRVTTGCVAPRDAIAIR